jgi:hypothetical protein
MTLQATLGGLTFVGDAGAATYTIDRDGGLKGWFDGVDSRHESIPRPASHGDFDVPTYLGGRIIILSGLVRASSASAYETALAGLSGLLADGSSATFTVTQAAGTLTATVRRNSAPDVQHVVYGALARYQLQLWAPDPRRYGATHTVSASSSISVAHDGNFPATPVLTIAGTSSGGYTVTGPGSQLITVTTALASGHPHTIDLATGALYKDGARVLGGISVYQPWTVPVGSSVTVSVSAGTVASSVKDTWI